MIAVYIFKKKKGMELKPVRIRCWWKWLSWNPSTENISVLGILDEPANFKLQRRGWISLQFVTCSKQNKEKLQMALKTLF